MARAPRLDRPGAWHHVMHRGARREAVFRRDDDCLLFLRSVGEAVEHHALEVHAYALMPNHYHLLVRTPTGNVSRAMRHVNSTYTQRLNLRRGWDGPVFRGRFRSQLVEDEGYLDHVFVYVHLNPFRAGLAARLDEPCWTSLRAYLGKERPPRWLRTDFFAEKLGGPAGIAEAVRSMRKVPEAWPETIDLETGWIRAAAEKPAPARGKARAAGGLALAAEALDAAASIVGCTVEEMKQRRMGPGANPARRFAVWALSRTGRLSHAEIGAALGMSEGQVAKVLWRLRRASLEGEMRDWMVALMSG